MVTKAERGKKYHHGALKDACLKEGLALLREGGANHFSLREVARRAGVSPTAIYHHFPDKSDLLAELAGVGLQDFSQRLHQAVGLATRPEEVISLMGRVYLDYFREHPYYLDLLFAPGYTQYENVVEVRSQTFRLLTTILIQFGVPVEEVDALALWVWSGIHGLATLIKVGVLGNPEDMCPPDAPEVFRLPLDELVSRVLPVISRVLVKGGASSSPAPQGGTYAE